MEAIELGKNKSQKIAQLINFGNENYDNDKKQTAIEAFSAAIAIYPANTKSIEEINGDIPDRNVILTKLGMLFTKYGNQLDPIGVHLFKQALIYNENDVEANYYLGKLLFNNGNVYEANLYLNKVLDNIDQTDKLYEATKEALDDINNQEEQDLPIFATDFVIGQALSHTMLNSPIGTFKKMDFDKIEKKYDDRVQLFPTEDTKKLLNKIRNFNSNHGFKQEAFEDFLPTNLPLFEVQNNLSILLGEDYTLIDQGAEIYDVCGVNVPPELTFNFYKLINNKTNHISYLLLSGKSPLEIKDEKVISDKNNHQRAIFDNYKTNVSYSDTEMRSFVLALAKEYFEDDVAEDNIADSHIWGIRDTNFDQTFDKHEDFDLADSRVEILIDTNKE
ncbi:hypothetical protein DY120_00350 [Apilactobacillus micheneri]|uniref:Tetratricopeptide repeat protein n=1 Tax=Apilactobacillus micheneri TaxID=1899430 RepID=A0ABY2YZ87_9LACO|nr:MULTISPECIES: hypothetical protein [Apilactobacillus]TPR26182.1 hypothetical protein DY114_00350 [Apilactobacillus micheneri]TPR26936.1 hypothetical protein DY111_00350 [Apilactobacillus micheneri]TPR27794.1 hypothetical protein DY113_04125 [Apilactobacillus micheneri]TPR31699.1 hypothetical protein DY117_00350 [Apilactobacillus micheneri]TPR32103.1 hypothetical protein DY120_00350 [Apilactobacillus micheneri]